MFQIASLNKVNEEKIEINKIKQSIHHIKEKKEEEYETLLINVSGNVDKNTYNFEFCLNCKMEELLKITDEKRIDFNDYIAEGTVILTINGKAEIDPEINASIIRCYKNSFSIFINFYTNYIEDNYCGEIEIDLDLDKYLNNNEKPIRTINGYNM